MHLRKKTSFWVGKSLTEIVSDLTEMTGSFRILVRIPTEWESERNIKKKEDQGDISKGGLTSENAPRLRQQPDPHLAPEAGRTHHD